MALSICLAVAARTYAAGRTRSSPHSPPFMQASATLARSRSVQMTPDPPHDTPSGVRIHQASAEKPIRSRKRGRMVSRKGMPASRSTMAVSTTVAAVSYEKIVPGGCEGVRLKKVHTQSGSSRV